MSPGRLLRILFGRVKPYTPRVVVLVVTLLVEGVFNVLLVGVALLLWTTVGRAVEESEPKVRLASKTKGARLSLVRVGSYYWREMSQRLRLTASFVRSRLPPPRLRVFKWLTAPQK